MKSFKDKRKEMIVDGLRHNFEPKANQAKSKALAKKKDDHEEKAFFSHMDSNLHKKFKHK